ncbi:MAG: hypothetical protein K0Q78_163 [Cellvibrio sp.]|nr:hypothetical protein [Cellvibrio sp.]
MTQIGEAIAALFGMDEPKKKIKKEKLKIRFSLFFDGTLNNRTNIEEREQFEMGTTTKPYKENGDGGSNSYDNGRTNIAIMEPHVPIKKDQKSETGYDYVFKIYIEGQGTFNRESDSGLGYSMGAGDSGVFSRARQGIDKALAELREYLRKYPPEEFEIEKIDVDVFGFSRGAATARHSIFLVTDKYWEQSLPLDARIRYLGYEEITDKNIEVKFAGVYDTVVSVNASQYSYWSDNKLNQRAIDRATKSIHLAAAEEHRIDFPLHTIKSAKTKGTGKEYYLPGVHSDVGGSYNLANEKLLDKGVENSTIKTVITAGSYNKMKAEKASLIKQGVFTEEQLVIEVTSRGGRGGVPLEGKLVEVRKLKGKEYMRSSSEVERIINDGYTTRLVEDRDWLISQGWYKKDEIRIEITGYDEAFQAYGNLIVNRRNIKSAYSNIPLKVMAKFARENKIEINPKLEDKANIILNKEPDLLRLESRINSYIGSVGNNSKPEDWLNDKGIKHIRHDHLHMSCKMAIGYNPRFKKGKRLRYYYEG